jgi:hypothetical protein
VASHRTVQAIHTCTEHILLPDFPQRMANVTPSLGMVNFVNSTRLDRFLLRSMIPLKIEKQEALQMMLMSRQFENEYAYIYIYFTPPPAAASRRVEA